MRRREVAYGIMMGTCLTLFVLAWAVVRRYSGEAAFAMSMAALVIPPVAVIVANWNIDRTDRADDSDRTDHLDRRG
ncbi:DUF3099 domain-containing protein [Actinomadura decatromicini]|uniref:DUF3099 domain-containing protein n=1 Tax=Actinomadura decatromicini TaxID=2604572 RepID=A0A5D3FBR4_9ACTN|nr:DUF3099 domain-containing protein [Actinomadura decatromicini]TYK45324.1 DUF3099 domain-containing protein [Actinomadura decatromicini]